MRNNAKDIELNILKQITPTQKQKTQLQQVIKKLQSTVTEQLKKQHIPIKNELVGSTAKDTYLMDNLDIDLFLLFPKKTPKNTLKNIGLQIGRTVLTDREECYAEHPYIRGRFHGYKTEIVPCYQVKTASQKISAVDRTPLHTKYIIEHLSIDQKQEVRLFKQFLKGITCYGAEAEIEGFSGYLCEILILNYHCFHDLILQARKWTTGLVLALKKGTYPEFNTPLTVIDPVDPERNVASALSERKFTLFINACQEYIKEPRETFFFPNPIHPWTITKIRKMMSKKKFIGIKFVKPEIIAENLYPQIRKSLRAIVELCEQYEFHINNATYHLSDKEIIFILNPQQFRLSQTMVHTGPPVYLEKNAQEFLNKWEAHQRTRSKPYQHEGRWMVEVERESQNITKLLQNQIPNISLGKHIDKCVHQSGFSLMKQSEMMGDDMRKFWTEYFDDRFPWER
jgi:tRNA nucleotidyltransferase (CCA-adding enzyme)